MPSFINSAILNITTIPFNQRLKDTITRLHTENPNNCIGKLRRFDYSSIIDAQATIRDWLQKSKLTLRSKHMPNVYAFMCAVVCELSSCDNWDDVYNQLRRCGRVGFPEFEAGDDQSHCACSHTVITENIISVLNETTHLHLLLGSTCGVKSGIITAAELKKRARPKCYEQMKQKRAYRRTIPSLWVSMTKRIIAKNATFRLCHGCRHLTVAKTLPVWRIRCIPCFKDFKNN